MLQSANQLNAERVSPALPDEVEHAPVERLKNNVGSILNQLIN